MKIISIFPCMLAAWTTVPMPALAQAGGGSELRLSCTGTGIVRVTESTSTKLSGNKDDEKITSSTSKSTQVPIQGTVQFAYTMDGPRMRLFPTMMPSNNAQGAGKWRKIDDFLMDDRNIKGNIDVGFFEVQLFFNIDRHTGEIQMSGGPRQFTGTCSKDDPNAKAKF